MDQVPNQRQWNTSIVLDESDGAERDNWSPGAHIHNGSAGQNGDFVVSLSGQRSAENGNSSTISFNGNITQNDLQGPLKGKELSELVGLMSDGVVYVNVHSGEFQNGEIRGQIVSGLPEKKINMTSTTSNNTIPN